LLTLILLACGRGETAAPGRDAFLALTGATVIDGRGSVLRNTTILIRGERIAGLFATGSRPLPPGAREIDLRGRFVTPGLIDSHVHLETRPRDPGVIEEILHQALLGGVTTVRDMGGNGVALTALARRANGGEIASPRIYYSGFLTGPDSEFWMEGPEGDYVAAGRPRGRSPWWRRLGGAQDVAAAVAEARAFGATGIKIHSGLDAGLLRLVAAEARRQGLRVWSHAAVTPAGPGDAVAAGVQVLSHADMLAFAALDDELPTPSLAAYRARAFQAVRLAAGRPERLARLLAEMRRRGTILEPTLFVIANAAEHSDPASRERLRAHLDYARYATRQAHLAHVSLCAGTDAIGGSSPNLHAELQQLVRYGGLTPMEAIVAATQGGAAALGIGRDFGTIERGKVADLAVFAADPSLDIRNSQTVTMVFRGGRRFDRPGPMRIPPGAEPPPA
jgi:imidazolonepropionase-like amidohydrolase